VEMGLFTIFMPYYNSSYVNSITLDVKWKAIPNNVYSWDVNVIHMDDSFIILSYE